MMRLPAMYARAWRVALVLATVMAITLPFDAQASSHRDAPLISSDPLADNTDVYAFRSPDAPDTVTIIANYHPMQLPHGGPNYYSFGEDIRYEIHIDNDASVPGDEIIYRFTFTKVNEDPTTFFNIRLGQQNQKLTYDMERSINGGTTFATVAGGIVPPNNIGPRSIEGPVGLNTTYSDLVDAAIATASSGEKVFCGPADDPFFIDLGGIFDVGDSPRVIGNPRDGLANFNVGTIAIQADISTLQKDGLSVSNAVDILDGNFVIGVWASASRREARTLNGDGTQTFSSNFVQVSRLGMPLTNEVVIPIGQKDFWHSLSPYDELAETTLDEYFYNPELGLYMDNSLFGGAVPAFAPLRIQRNSLQTYDFGNTNDGLHPLKGSGAVAGTALDDALFGTLLLPGNGKPRSVDVWPLFHTGIPNLAPYQLATGKTGNNPLTPGKPFVNNFLPNGGDMLRLNMAVPVTPRDDPNFSSLGLVRAAVLGLSDPTFNTTTTLEFIPNMDGFPNGRRLEDDVVRIELQAMAGVFLAAIGLGYDDYTVGGANLITQDFLDVLAYSTGIETNSPPSLALAGASDAARSQAVQSGVANFGSSFPYVLPPSSGTGAASGTEIPYVQPAILPPSRQGNGADCSNASTCVSGICSDGVCCDDECDGEGQVCNLPSSVGVCTNVPPTRDENGADCSDASTCLSGFCSDGVCCDDECDGEVQACNLPSSLGVCTNVATASPAPVLSGPGLFAALVVLSMVAFATLGRFRRRGR